VSLLSFHRGLISVAILFCLGYGTWELLRLTRPGAEGSFILGSVFILLGLGLAFYLARLNHFLGYEDGPHEA
jgi:hypothetical protein